LLEGQSAIAAGHHAQNAPRVPETALEAFYRCMGTGDRARVWTTCWPPTMNTRLSELFHMAPACNWLRVPV
jgi:hypothetical protein